MQQRPKHNFRRTKKARSPDVFTRLTSSKKKSKQVKQEELDEDEQLNLIVGQAWHKYEVRQAKSPGARTKASNFRSRRKSPNSPGPVLRKDLKHHKSQVMVDRELNMIMGKAW